MQGITNPICKESAFNAADSGKIDYFKPPDLDSKSTACGFFTDDVRVNAGAGKARPIFSDALLIVMRS